MELNAVVISADLRACISDWRQIAATEENKALAGLWGISHRIFGVFDCCIFLFSKLLSRLAWCSDFSVLTVPLGLL